MSLTLSWTFILLAAINSTIGNLLLKQSQSAHFDKFDIQWANFLFNPWFISGLFFYGLNVILFSKALEVLPVSVAYPVLASIGFIILSIFSHFFFGEEMSIKHFLGLFFIIFGIYFLSSK